jgi:hypothetical protein
VAGKRHHYTPGFLLRRFAERTGKRQGLIWRLDKKTGQARAVAPRYEAARRHYYRLVREDGTTDSSPEDLLSAVENAAARIIRKIDDGASPADEDRAWLALFVALQHRRTPPAREWLKYYDETLAGMTTEIDLSNEERFRERAGAETPELTYEEVEELRTELLADLRAGRIKVESTPSREVAIMFNGLDRVAFDLVYGFTWGVVRLPDGADLVLPDMGITQYDPTPPFPGSGLGFGSSPNAETILPVDPRFALVITPGPATWHDAEISARHAEDINLRSYAWSDVATYGRSQKSVSDVRRLARKHPRRLAELAPRSGKLWVADVPEEARGGDFEFTGYAPSGTSRQRFSVSPEAFERPDDEPNV